MRARLFPLALAGSGLAAAPAPARAQAPAPTAVPGCTYDTCALRRERVFFSERVLAGARGRVVGRPQFFGALPVEGLVRAVPEAVPYARTYRREERLGRALTFVGFVLSTAALIDAADNSRGCVTNALVTTCGSDGFRSRDTALLAGGVVAGGVGGWRLQVSDRALNRALWWYNRALAR